ncbi:MAG: tetratricopeptide repeat protein [Luteolibacter sp.]|uniref:tetratricopeptide repeat protein n=1 Tax=Luteolibacter sp. TaxID=1962973 RepID=UPI00326581DE
MRLRSITQLLLFSALTASVHAAVSLPSDSSAAVPAVVDGPAKEAMKAFQDGRHAKAVELAKPLADQGNAEALYLMGFAHETGRGVEASKEKALEYYRKAAAAKHKDAAYRLSFILLASEKEEERDQAREALETAAKDDPAVAGRILGEAYLRGRLTPAPDPDKAIFWWKRAADAGDVPSMLLMARFYEGQFGFPELKDTKEALATYAKAAGLGDAGAMAALGSRLLSGDEKIRDEKKGREWLKKAVEAKEYSAYLALGDYEENVKKDLKAALAEYERGKDAGQIDCILRTADFYLEGKGVEKDSARGLALLEKAAEAGSAAANFRLAVQALSVEKPDLLVGYKHLVAAANGNLVEAQNELGLLYLSGKLAVADSAAGVAWLTRAAQGGYAQAQNNLATLYERGAAGVTQNMENAGQLYALAANQGHGGATLALARLVYQGIGTKSDPVKAWALATLAQERKAEDADKLVTEITDKLDDKQKTEAKKQLEDMKSGKTDDKSAAKPDPKAAPAPVPKKAK